MMESEQIKLAVKLIHLGARLQLLESQTSLSREKLIKLYKEVKGISPPKGMLPYAPEWFLTWQPNVHSTMFMNIHKFLSKNTTLTGLSITMKAYEIYSQQISSVVENTESILSFTRAWTLTRFFESNMLSMKKCTSCSGIFVADNYDISAKFCCSLCNVPSRAGKSKKAIQYSIEKMALTV